MKVNFVSEFKKLKGISNMEIDLSMLDSLIENSSNDYSVRFYGWNPPCVSLGRNQKEFQTGIKIDTVRRPTGGRALLHDMEITYSIAGKIKKNDGVLDTYKMVSDVLINSFKRLDIPLEYAGDRGGNKKYCMNISSGADICYMGKKFIGSAQFRKEGYFLQHGSILLDVDYELLEKVFMEKVEKDKIITLRQISPNLTVDNVLEALKTEFLKLE